MRIAFSLHRWSPYSGLARDLEKIATLAAQRGHHVTVLVREWQGPPPAYGERVVLPATGLSNHACATRFARAVGARLAAGDFDVAVGFNKVPGLDVYFAADDCFALHVRQRPYPYRYTPRARALTRLEASVFSAPYQSHVLVLSERAQCDYQEHYGTPDDRFHLLPPNLEPHHLAPPLAAAERRRLRQELGTGEHDLLLLMVGSAFDTKGVDRAIRGLAALPAGMRSRAVLAVAGEGHARPMRRLATQCGVADRTHFLGGRGDVAQLLRASDLLLHPARRELAGIVLLETLAAGLPVLTTQVCGYAHHVDVAGGGVVLGSPFSQQQFNDTLAVLLADPGRRRKLGLAGRRYAASRDMSAMPRAAVDVIEAAGRGELALNPPPPGDACFFYLSDEVRAALPPGRDSFEDIMRRDGELFRSAPGRETLRFELAGRGYFLKRHSGVGWGEIAKNLCYLRLPVTGARDEWRAAHHLRRVGIQTPSPAGFGQCGANPARRRSFLISDEVTHAVSLEDWGKDPGRHSPRQARHRRTLIERVALVARIMHRNGVNHRDFYLCHLWLRTRTSTEQADTTASDLVVMDLHRAQIRRSVRLRWLIKDIAALYFSSMELPLTQRDLYRFMRVYRGAPLRQTLAEDAVFWRRVQQRAERMWRREIRKGTQTQPAARDVRPLSQAGRH